MSIRADGEHEFNRSAGALHPPGQHRAERRLVLITAIDMQRVFIAGWHAAEALGEFQTSAAENARFGFVAGGVRKKPFQIACRFAPRTQRGGLGRFCVGFKWNFRGGRIADPPGHEREQQRERCRAENDGPGHFSSGCQWPRAACAHARASGEAHPRPCGRSSRRATRPAVDPSRTAKSRSRCRQRM